MTKSKVLLTKCLTHASVLLFLCVPPAPTFPHCRSNPLPSFTFRQSEWKEGRFPRIPPYSLLGREKETHVAGSEEDGGPATDAGIRTAGTTATILPLLTFQWEGKQAGRGLWWWHGQRAKHPVRERVVKAMEKHGAPPPVHSPLRQSHRSKAATHLALWAGRPWQPIHMKGQTMYHYYLFNWWVFIWLSK